MSRPQGPVSAANQKSRQLELDVAPKEQLIIKPDTEWGILMKKTRNSSVVKAGASEVACLVNEAGSRCNGSLFPRPGGGKCISASGVYRWGAHYCCSITTEAGWMDVTLFTLQTF